MARGETEKQESQGHSHDDERSSSSNGARPKKRLPGLQVFERPKEQLSVITGRSPDSVSGFSPVDDGWELTIEMVDIEKIPPTTSVMASYAVTVDDEGNILEYQLVSRYVRGQTKDES